MLLCFMLSLRLLDVSSRKFRCFVHSRVGESEACLYNRYTGHMLAGVFRSAIVSERPTAGKGCSSSPNALQTAPTRPAIGGAVIIDLLYSDCDIDFAV